MKKTLLIFGVVGALCATNGYGGKQSVVVYTCNDGCDITNDATGCTYSNGKDCGKPAASIFVPQTSMPMTTVAPKNQPQKSDPVSARAAKTTRPNVSKPTKPNGPDKSANGYVHITCPEGCTLHCSSTTGGQTNYCECQTSDGRLCEERVKTGENKPVSF